MNVRALHPRDGAQDGHQVLLVENASRMLDTKGPNGWSSRTIGPAGNLPSGVYDLTRAKRPVQNVPSKTYAGTTLHVSDKHVFQLYTAANGRPDVVRHARHLFQTKPIIGNPLTVTYDYGRGRIVHPEQSRTR